MIKILALLFCFHLTTSAAWAEWLVFRDGSTQEIKGPWKVQGKQLVFTAKSGTLQSVLAAEVDLAASEQLSRNALPDRGLKEIQSGPTVAYKWGIASVASDLAEVLDPESFAFIWSLASGKAKGINAGLNCTPTRIVGVKSGTEWWLQSGTKVERFRLLGLATADLEALRALTPDGLICFETDRRVPSPTADGSWIGYAQLPDGRDVGLELIRLGAAQLGDEPFSRRQKYLNAAK